MIIKEIKIDAFGGLVNKEISFSSGMNIVFGENEKGKSTMEAFIKTMLYGMSNKRSKGESERKRYLPFNGQKIKGTMVVENKGREYIIQRSFGATKKEDLSVIIDKLTGEEIHDINKDEPGRSFLGINKSTFEKTLFINQLGVSFSKDKEEEIMDKITAIFGCGDEEVPVARAIEKLEVSKKELTTSRGVGLLDQLKKKYSDLLQERYEAYSLSEKNLQWENDLLREKEKRKELREEITKLELYKKYLKKINLQKEYKDITEYLKKSEELKKEENEINKNLGSDLIDENFIDSLKDENKIYLGMLDRKEELKEELRECEELYNKKNSELNDYKFVEIFDGNLNERLLNIKYEQQSLNEKLQYINSLKSSIDSDKEEINKKKNILGINENLDGIEEIDGNLKEYEETLKTIKSTIESNDTERNIENDIKSEKIKKIIGIIGVVAGIICCFFKFPIIILGILLIIVGGVLFYKSTTNINELKISNLQNEELENLNVRLRKIEDILNSYVNKLNLKDYSQLIAYLNKYKNFQEFKNRMLFRIDEKNKIIEESDYYGIKSKYQKNEQMLNSLKNISECKDIDEILEKTNKYYELSKEKNFIDIKLENLKENIETINSEIEDKECKLRKSMELMNLDLANLLDLEVYIKEYKAKINKRNEIHSNLMSMEETYKALLKDRDIEQIKVELKDIISENNQYSYQTEEEIEVEEKNKSNELIECEKKIKDLENSINSRFIGKRSIINIEEEISNVNEKINKYDEKVKALEIAINTLNESFTEIRRDIGPTINKKITEYFNLLTDNKYSEVMLGDNYEMMVKNSENLFKGSYLSNGAWDQLYLALRLTFVDLIFENEEYPLILDDAFVQYDDNRREKALLLIYEKLNKQGIIFTCQRKEEEILIKNSKEVNIINL